MGEAGAAAGTAPDLRRTADLEAAYRAHAAELHRFAARRLCDHGAAADVVQEVFVRAWRHADRYDRSAGSLRVWLFAIARNVVVDQVRRARSRPAAPTSPEQMPERVAGDEFSDDLVTAWFVEEALARLAPEHRTALVETHLRGRPHAEVAAELGVAVGTVRSRVFYGLKKLRQIVDDMGVAL